MDWLLLMIERRMSRMSIDQGLMTRQNSLMILCWIFVVLVDLTLIVYSITIKNIKNNWITSKIDEL